MRLPITTVVLAALCFAAAPVLGEGEPPQIELPAVQVTSAPKIDGVLDDECWTKLPMVTNFTDMSTRVPVKVQTKAWIGYDSRNIYVAIYAYHTDPSKIKADETKRNGTNWWKDDVVHFFVDSRHAHRGANAFRVTARGVQSEEIERSSSEKIEYRGDWQGAAKTVSDGYTVEMAIPFSQLIYANGQDTFGISFGRDHADQHIYAAWPDLNGTGDTKFYAHWTGLKLPKVRPRPQLLGYVLGGTGGDQRRNYQGLDIKYPFTPDSLGVASINPDFYSVEQQVESVDFSYTERYLDDARPFFNEWELPVDGRVFYSRRISDFDTGLKYAANSGRNAYGVLTTRTFGEQSDSVASFSHDIGDKSGLIFNAAEHNTPGHRNLVSYYRGRIGSVRGQRSYRLTGGLYDSSTTGQPGGQSHYVNYSSSGGNGDLAYYCGFSRTDSTFNDEIGYSDDIGIKGSYWGVSREIVYRGKFAQYVQMVLDTENMDYIDGRHYNSMWSSYMRVDYSNGSNIRFGTTRQRHEQFDESVPFVSFRWNRYAFNGDGAAGISWGRKAGGKYRQLWANQKFRLSPRLALGLQSDREFIGETSPYAGIRRQTIVTLNYDITSERGLGGRLVAQQGKRNVYFMYRQQVRHGTDAYLIYGDPNADSTDGRLMLKMMRVL